MLIHEKFTEIIESLLFAANKPLTERQLQHLFPEGQEPELKAIVKAVDELKNIYHERGIELVKVASGYRFQVRADFSEYVSRLWEEKPQRYSKALLETLALIAYRQPITRGEIEEIRGVATSTNLFRTLQEERGWVRIVGHKDVPGRPGLYATTKEFLDHFNLESLDKLPALPEILAMEDVG